MIWPDVHDADPAMRWLREVIGGGGAHAGGGSDGRYSPPACARRGFSTSVGVIRRSVIRFLVFLRTWKRKPWKGEGLAGLGG